VTCASAGSLLDSCLASIRAQTEPPAAVCIVCDAAPGNVGALAANEGWRIVVRAGTPERDAETTAAELMAAGDPSLAGLAFVDARARLDPGVLSICGAAFARDDRLGILSGWTRETQPQDHVRIQSGPAAPCVWHDQEIAPFVAVRAEALAQVLHRPGDQTHARSRRSMLDDVMRSGWTAVTYPGALCSIAPDPGDAAIRSGSVRYSSMAQAVQRLHMPLLRWLRTAPPADQREFLRTAMRSPLRSAWRLARRRSPGRP